MSAIAVLSEVTLHVLNCAMCGENPIDAPVGTTAGTKFTCRWCVARTTRDRNVEEGRAFGAEERARIEQAKKRREALLARRAANTSGASCEVVESARERSDMRESQVQDPNHRGLSDETGNGQQIRVGHHHLPQMWPHL